jgi:ankyrin repeat protein
LDDLAGCTTEQQFYSALEQFPQTLDETYARILDRIRPEDRQRAKRALLWLSHSKRPLRIDEFAEAIAIDPTQERLVESYTGFSASNNMLVILGTLVVTRRRGLADSTAIDESMLAELNEDIPEQVLRSDQVQEVFLSHYSVKEYLTSERVLGQSASDFGASQLSANRFLAHSSLRYIFEYDSRPTRRTSDDLNVYPLLPYACTFWYIHAKSTPIGKPNNEQACVDDCIHNLFRNTNTAMKSWLRIHRPDEPNWAPFEGFTKYSLGTPLHYAAYLGLPTVVKLLLDEGADPNATNDEMYTPLHGAVLDKDNVKTVQVLLQGHANVNARTSAWRTPLMFAVQKDCRETIGLLLEAGADLETPDKGGWTALYWSAQCHRVDVLQWLISIGANLDPRTTSSGTPLHQVSGWGYQIVMTVLLNAGADVDAVDVRGEMPLHYAAKAGRAMAVLLLLESGAAINWKDLKGLTAKDKASNGGHVEVVELLQSTRSGEKRR